MRVPDAVRAFASRGPAWTAFVDALPTTLDDLVASWSLTVDGEPTHGECAVVVPVRADDGTEAALKVGFVDEETRHEHVTLRAWDGRVAVRLLRADPARGALLLERAGPRSLASEPVLRSCSVVASLYADLHVPAPGRLVRLSTLVGRWSEELAALPADAPVPHRLVDQAVSLGRTFAADPGCDGVAIHADLHDENVLASRREVATSAAPGGGAGPWAARNGAWLVIDPKGISGDPHYEPAPMLWNRWDEVVATGDVRTAVRRRFHTIVDDAGLDEDRARDWVVVRMMHDALWTVQDAQAQRRRLGADDRAWITRCVAVAKAVQD